MKKARKWDKARAACDALTEEQQGLVNELVTRLADKWSLWTLATLAESEGPLRFSRVMATVEGISQKSLTKTLRQLERDGLVTRQVFAEVPPRVEYALTELGMEMLEHVEPLWSWVAANVGVFGKARVRYDGRR